MILARYLPRFRKAYAALEVLEEREQWSRDQIREFQLDRLNQLWAHARQQVPYYRSLAEANQLPSRFDSLEHYSQAMPVLSKEQLRSGGEQLLSKQLQPGDWHRTGGSTGVPLKVYWSNDAHREMLWHKYRMEQAWGLDIFDKKAFLWGHAASFASGWKGVWQRRSQKWFDRMRQRTRLNAYHLGQSDLRHYLDVLSDQSIRTIYGYSSSVALLAAEAERLGTKLPDLRLAILTAEPADEQTLATVERGLGVPAAIEYGSVECGVIATGMPDGKLHVCEDVIYLELAPRDDGRFDLIVTILNNPCYPLLRYAIGDITDQPLATNSPGYAVLANVTGRSNDVLLSKSGSMVHPLAVKHALEWLSEARRFQAHQDTSGQVHLQLECDNSIEPDRYGRAQQLLTELLEGYEVTVQVSEHIPANQAGKHRWVTSELAATNRN